MLLRISLGIAILAGLGALYLSQFQVKPKIDDLTTRLGQAETERATAQEAERKAKSDAGKARTEADTAKKELNEKSAALETTAQQLDEQRKRGDQLQTDLVKITGERNDSQQQLAAWKATGLEPGQIRTLQANLARMTEERDAVAGENKILLRTARNLRNELEKYVGDREKDPEMPAGLKGKILAVDSKYDFVVVDVGGNQGVVPRGKFLVSRDGRLVGAVRVTRVEPDRSIANIIPEMAQGELKEGDQVLY